ncbi:circadian clock KaiB family protein [Acaryochloris sp. IP29b_bin.137]|uniref:circadian clock KaiB family protein n=1 Tax=Acaryochloris sp. IP29b_bin.137 TaxID=2969217 RepID=UPI00262847F7|nr:circadian clock KaiB family protein [Acaryochloris sp. IP29b_bin.137]
MSKLHLKLYISGYSLLSRRAVTNLKQICRVEFEENCDIEIIDVIKSPQLAELANITVTPTLVKESPPPIKRLVGDLSQSERVISELEPDPECPY